MHKLLIPSLLKLLSLLPLRIAHGLGAIAGLCIYIMPTRMRRVTDINLALCFPERTPDWRRRIARASLIETGKSLAEAPYLWRAGADRIDALVKQRTGQATMDEAVAQNRGVILAAPHLGSWELCGLYSATQSAITSLYRPPRLQSLENIMRVGREHTGARLVPTEAHGIKSLVRALDEQQCVGILPDQVPNPGNGIYAPFFGIDAYTMVLIARLARKRRVPVIFMYGQRLKKAAGFCVHYRRVGDDIYDPNPVTAAAAVNSSVERMVRECPEQYGWSYKRFKDRPPGAPQLY
ncbi:MAG: lysophospholipid acyltransferase family protein [Gammaproteobacteria bacterium]